MSSPPKQSSHKALTPEAEQPGPAKLSTVCGCLLDSKRILTSQALTHKAKEFEPLSNNRSGTRGSQTETSPPVSVHDCSREGGKHLKLPAHVRH